VESVVQTLEQTIAKIHIANWVYSFWEVNASWHLAISMSPLMLNAFHVPLVDNHNDSLSFALVDRLEEVLVTLVDEDLFQSWEENGNILDVPVDQMRIDTLLGELGGL
jgi:hypothetical protein